MDEKPKTKGKPQIKDLEIGLADVKLVSDSPDTTEADIQPQSLHFRLEKSKHAPSRANRLVYLAAFVVIAFISFAALIRFVPEARDATIVQLKEWTEISKSEQWKVVTPALIKVTKMVRSQRPPKTMMAAMPVTNKSETCSTFIKDSLNKKIKTNLDEGEFLHLMNCELFQDSPKHVIQALSRKKISFDKVTSWAQMPLSLIALEATRRIAPFSPLSNFSKQGCLRWTPSADCLMRYVDESRAQFKSRWIDGKKVLEDEVSKQAPNVQAWYQMSNALYATKDREYAKAQGFLEIAALLIRDEPNPYLEREIYRNAVLNAYSARDSSLMNKAKALRPVERAAEDINAFLDVNLLTQLRNKDAQISLENYLSQPESVQRFVSDARFINIVLSQSQVLGLEQHGLTFAEAVFGSRESVRGDAIGETMVILYARMWIGADKPFEALELLTTLEKSGYHSAELYHLKGIAQLLSFKKPELKLLAAKDFQTAGGMSRNEDTLFALVVALLGSKNQSKAEQVMAQWTSLGAASQKTIWYGFAKGLVSYSGGNKVEAKALWDANEKAFPHNPMWPKLKTNLSEDVGYLDTDMARRLVPMMTCESPLGSLALFGQKS